MPAPRQPRPIAETISDVTTPNLDPRPEARAAKEGSLLRDGQARKQEERR